MKTINVGEVAVFDHVEPSKEQALKPLEEAAEVFGAWQEWEETKSAGDAVRVIDEIADTIQACVNLASALGAGNLSCAMESCKDRNIWRRRITKENPEVLDADGVPIKFGDELYLTDGFIIKLKCVGFSNDGLVKITGWESSEGWVPIQIEANELTHKKPDSWEQLAEDEEKSIKEYWGCQDDDEKLCCECEHSLFKTGSSCATNKYKDLFRRAKALAGVKDESL